MTSPSEWRGVRVLVVGASGFIGRHVITALRRSGAQVSVGVKSLDAPRTSFPLNRDALIAMDATNPETIAAGIARARPAIVFNLAGYGIDPAQRDEDLAEQINGDLPAAIARAMRVSGDPGWRGQQVVHVGSALEYGTASGDLNEGTACAPTTLYGLTKLQGTLGLRAAAADTGVRAVTARLFTVYGSGERAGRLLPSLIEAARTQLPIPLTVGEQQRDFTWVGDVAATLLDLGALSTTALDVVNVATGQLSSVRSFVEKATDVLGIDAARLQWGALPTRTEEMRHAPVNVGRLRSLTGHVPDTTIREGVRLTRFGRI